VLLHPQAVAQDGGDALRVLALLLAELPTKTAVKLAADITGAPRNSLYDAALQMKRNAQSDNDGEDSED
jgi:16S rRNA (cytidine1402-2'-O)-methyltransferase